MITIIRAFLISISLLLCMETFILWYKNERRWSKLMLFLALVLVIYFGLVAIYVWNFKII